MTVVLDSSALLAISFSEPGRNLVEDALPEAVVSAVNAAELVAKILDKGEPPDLAEASLGAFDIPVIPFDEPQAMDAALLRGLTRHAGLSLGDRACLALARSLNAPVMTADRAWADLDLGVEIRLIR
jgi:ribonuclease VapC